MVNLNEAQLDAVFGALADSTRRTMLQQLGQGECRVSDLAKDFPISAPAISRHLRVLERVGLIERRVLGREHILRIRPEPLAGALALLEQYREFWQGSFDRLDNLLQEDSTASPSKPSTQRKQ